MLRDAQHHLEQSGNGGIEEESDDDQIPATGRPVRKKILSTRLKGFMLN